MTTPTIQVGGPPPTARHIRSVLVLHAAPLHGCAFPGTRGKRDDRADEHGQPLPAIPAKQVAWTHLAHRAAIRGVHEARILERRVVVWEDGGWWVQVHDGWGRVVDDLTAAPYEMEVAREVANAAVDDLRGQGRQAPGKWRIAR